MKPPRLPCGLPAALSLLLLAGCAVSTTTPVDDTGPASSVTLRLIGRQTLGHLLQFGGTTVGGLSSIDRDAAADVYYLVSDDRSAFAPTRFYTARLAIDERGFHDVALQTVVTLLRPDGRPFGAGEADAEAMRFDPWTDSLWWTSEGARRPSRLIDPFIRHAALDGRYLGEVPLAPMFHVTHDDRGPRDNLVFEGASLSFDGASLWVSMEAPLLQDGPMPTPTDGAWVRISRYDRDASGGFGPLAAQFAYRLGPLPVTGPTLWKSLNGISEILVTAPRRMLVLERAFVLGAGWRIRLYEADWSAATDVANLDALERTNTAFVPMTRRLLLDFDKLGITVDNLEGLCFGPTLANGHRTLVLVADDNFNPGEITQFLAFEIVPREPLP